MRFGSWMLSGVLREEAKEGGEGGGGAAAPAAGKEGGEGKAAEPAVDAKAMQAEIDRLKAENSEAQNLARYWHEQVKGKQPEAKPAAKKEEPAEDEDLIGLITTKGTKGLLEHLKKTGNLVTKDEVDQTVQMTRAQVAEEAKVQAEYPELKEGTDFFKAAAPRYKTLIESGVPHVIALRVAAEQTELAGYKSGTRLTKAEKEEREARARAQAPDKKKQSTAPADTEADEDLTDFQKTICDRMGISYDKYKENAKKGPVFRFE